MANNLTPNFFIKTFTIHVVEGASCVNIGSNRPTGFTSFKKHNQGFGSVNGNQNTIDGIKTLLSDNSLLDMFHNTNEEDATWINEIKDIVFSKVDAYLETADVVEEDGEDSFTNMDDELEFIDELEKIGVYEDEEMDDDGNEYDHDIYEDEDEDELAEEKVSSIIDQMVTKILSDIIPNINAGAAETGNRSEQEILKYYQKMNENRDEDQ